MTTQAAMHARIVALYNFHPAKLTEDERHAKSVEMGKFWEDVKVDPGKTLPMLRIELRDTSNPAFFMTDGSELLLSLSEQPSDGDIVAGALTHSDLDDMDSGAYFYAVHALSMKGINTTAAALHMLDRPSFAVPVPQHAMTLDQQSCLTYVLIPLDSAVWMSAARARFAAEKDETALKSLLALFFFEQSAEADAALAAAAKDSTKPEAVRKDAQEYLDDEQKALQEKIDVNGTEASIRADRAKRMGAVSDESMGDTQEMTVRLIQLRHGAK